MEKADVIILGGGLVGSALAVALDTHGLSAIVVDIADPTRPREVASFVPPAAVDPFRTFTDTAQVWGVYVQGNLLLASDINAGLFVLGYER